MQISVCCAQNKFSSMVQQWLYLCIVGICYQYKRAVELHVQKMSSWCWVLELIHIYTSTKDVKLIALDSGAIRHSWCWVLELIHIYTSTGVFKWRFSWLSFLSLYFNPLTTNPKLFQDAKGADKCLPSFHVCTTKYGSYDTSCDLLWTS